MVICQSGSEDVLKVVQHAVMSNYGVKTRIGNVSGGMGLKELRANDNQFDYEMSQSPALLYAACRKELLTFAEGARMGAVRAFRMVQSWEEEGK